MLQTAMHSFHTSKPMRRKLQWITIVTYENWDIFLFFFFFFQFKILATAHPWTEYFRRNSDSNFYLCAQTDHAYKVFGLTWHISLCVTVLHTLSCASLSTLMSTMQLNEKYFFFFFINLVTMQVMGHFVLRSLLFVCLKRTMKV